METQVILILVLIDVQYSQKVIFSFKKDLTGQKSLLLRFPPPGKKIPQSQNFPHSLLLFSKPFFNPTKNPKNLNFEEMKKMPGDRGQKKVSLFDQSFLVLTQSLCSAPIVTNCFGSAVSHLLCPAFAGNFPHFDYKEVSYIFFHFPLSSFPCSLAFHQNAAASLEF